MKSEDKKNHTKVGAPRIDKKQIQLIHIAIHQLKIPDSVYRDMLWVMFKKKSCKDLSRQQAGKLLHEFRARGFKMKAGSSPRRRLTGQGPGPSNERQKRAYTRASAACWPKNVTWFISPKQKSKILELLGELGWSFDAFLSWIPKQFPFKHPGNRSHASDVISRLIAVRRADLKRRRAHEAN
jgi:hypothetical protein